MRQDGPEPAVPPECPPPDPDPRPAGFRPPSGACDTHAHVIGPQARYPFVASRSYTPPDALLEDYLRVVTTLGLQRVVLVQPSMHGTDNRALLEAVAAINTGTRLQARAVAVIAGDATERELEELHEGGVRALRLNLVYRGGGTGLADVRPMAERARSMGWHLQVLIDVSRTPQSLAQLEELDIPLVIDHMGHLPAACGVRDPGFQALLRTLSRGQAWVKVSGAYRLSAQAPPYGDVRPFATELLAAAPGRVLWGSDWPHTVCRPPMPNDGQLLDLLWGWCDGDAGLVHRVLVTNPAALFDFGSLPPAAS